MFLMNSVPSTGSKWKSRSPAVTYIGGIAEERGIREMLAAMDLLPRIWARLELAGRFFVAGLQTELQRVHNGNMYAGMASSTATALPPSSRVRAGLVVLSS